MTAPMAFLPAPNFGHMRTMTGRFGIRDHSLSSSALNEHGFCTNANARALVVVCRQAASDSNLADLAEVYLDFVLGARRVNGGFHNLRSKEGDWVDEIGGDDSQGRAWWSLGAVARHGYEPWMRRAGVAVFDECSGFNSNHLRSNAFAVLGAADLLAVEPTHSKAQALLIKSSHLLAVAVRARIPWPEIRLTYDNARIPDALIAAGAALGDVHMIDTGVRLLERLLWVETAGDHLSFPPVGGWQAGEPRPGFDQQPLEAAALAEACHRAWTITGNSVWRVRALRSAHWLMGRNDTGAVLYDAATGVTRDGLKEDSARDGGESESAESTLAGLAILQIAAACLKKSPTPARM